MPSDLTPADLDLMARTMIGEESTPEGRAAVGQVILNRINSGKFPSSVRGVVFQPNAFESWSTRGRQLSSIPTSSKDYRAAYALAQKVASGDLPDETKGSVNFINPTLQVAMGRQIPSWAQGKPTAVIGKQAYFGGDPMASDDFLTDFSVAPEKGAGASVPASTPAKPAAISDGSDFERDFAVAPEKPVIAATAAQPTAPIGVNDAVRSVATGVPIIGGLLNKADAATNALLAPVLNPLFDKKDQLAGQTWSDRYHNALLQQQGMDTAFEKAHPTANTALNITGGIAGTIPAMMAAPGLFGLGEGTLVGNSLLSGITGAGINATDTAVRGGDLNDIEHNALIGGAFGGLAPSAGKLVGSGLEKLTNVLSSTTPAARNVANILQDIGMSPQEAEIALKRMGPEATLADLDPALTTEAGGLASMGGKPTSVLKNAMKARAANVDNRVSELMEKQLGPAPDAEATLKSIHDEASEKASPFYKAGKEGPEMDVTPVLQSISEQLPNASGGTKSLLTNVRGFLTNEVASKTNPLGMTVPKSNPEAVLGARQALDDIMYNRETGEAKLGPNAMRVASDLRAQLDQIVKSNDNFAQGDAIYAQAKNEQRAFKQGQEIFSSNIRPVDLARMLERMSPEEVAALKKGARASIADALQSSRRGEGPAAQGLFGRSTNNRANLNLLFPNAQETLDALHSEAMMRGTEQRVAQNSATAERQAVQQKYAPKGESPIDTGAAVVGHLVDGGTGAVLAMGGKAALGAARNALTSRALNKLTEGTARGLVATGPEQRAFLQQVARAARTNAIHNVLASRGAMAANLLTRSAGDNDRQGRPLIRVLVTKP